MTPTTTEQAKVNPWWVDELTLHWGHGHSSHDTRRAAKTAIDQVEALTKERDEYKQRTQRLMTTLLETKKERDELAAAAKLALDALESLFGVPAEFTGVGGGAVAVWRLGGSDKPRKAITALRQAGVQ